MSRNLATFFLSQIVVYQVFAIIAIAYIALIDDQLLDWCLPLATGFGILILLDLWLQRRKIRKSGIQNR